jgi:hypothetical protein
MNLARHTAPTSRLTAVAVAVPVGGVDNVIVRADLIGGADAR